MVELQPTYGISLRISGAILWRSLIMGFPVYFLTGFFTAGAFSALGSIVANAMAWLSVFLAMVLVQGFCIKLVIGQAFGKARLTLVDDNLAMLSKEDGGN